MRRWENTVYKLVDYLIAILAWYLFIQYLNANNYFQPTYNVNKLYKIGLLIVPFTWFIIFTLFEQYNDVYRLSRWSVFSRTLLLSLVGCILFVLLLMANRAINFENRVLEAIFRYFMIYFGLLIFWKMSFLSFISSRIKMV